MAGYAEPLTLVPRLTDPSLTAPLALFVGVNEVVGDHLAGSRYSSKSRRRDPDVLGGSCGTRRRNVASYVSEIAARTTSETGN